MHLYATIQVLPKDKMVDLAFLVAHCLEITTDLNHRLHIGSFVFSGSDTVNHTHEAEGFTYLLDRMIDKGGVYPPICNLKKKNK